MITMADRLFQLFDIKSRWVFEGEKRLNASSYFFGSIKAKILLTKLIEKGIKLDNLGKFSNNIFVGAPGGPACSPGYRVMDGG